MEGSHPTLSVQNCEDVRPQPERNTHHCRTLKLCLFPFMCTLDSKVMFAMCFLCPYPITIDLFSTMKVNYFRIFIV